MQMRVAGLIVARGGSKSIPRKNLQRIGGIPLVAHTFLCAMQSGVLERIIVSTDDTEIADVARQWGCEVPFMRPAELARDDSHVMFATLHAIRWLEEHEHYCPDYFMLLQPTSPLRLPRDIRAALHLARLHDAEAVVSVVPVKHHPFWTKTIDDEGRLRVFIESGLACSRRQALPPVFCLNGAIYMVRRLTLLEKQSWCPEGAYGYVMPPERSLDVDSAWDLELIRMIIERGRAEADAELVYSPNSVREQAFGDG